MCLFVYDHEGEENGVHLDSVVETVGGCARARGEMMDTAVHGEDITYFIGMFERNHDFEFPYHALRVEK